MKLYWNTANGLQRSSQPTPPCTFDRLARRVKTADKDLGGYENFVFYEKESISSFCE
jgi:hypothetical protein